MLGDGDDHFSGNGLNFQLAVFRSDSVVGSIGVVIQLVGEAVVAFADFGLAAGHGVGCAFAVNEAGGGDGDFVLGERSAVVDLLVGAGGQSDFARGDFKRTVDNLAKRVALGDVSAAVSSRDVVASDFVHNFAFVNINHAALDDYVQYVAIYEDALSEGVAVLGERGAVIGLAVAGCLDGDDCGYRAYHEAAVVCLDDDVLLCRVSCADGAFRKCCGIGACIGARRADGDGGEVSLFRCSGEAAYGVLRAIIGLAVAVRGQGDVLIIIEGNYVIVTVGIDRDALGNIVLRDDSAVGNRFGVRGESLADGLAVENIIFGDLLISAVPEISDSAACLIELEVKLQDEAAVRGDDASLNVSGVGLVVDVLAVLLGQLVVIGDGDGGVGLALTGNDIVVICLVGVIAFGILIVELDLVVHVDGFPDGVEVVEAIVVQTGFGACGVVSRICVSRVCPALELVAETGGKTRCVVSHDGDLVVVGNGVSGKGLIIAGVICVVCKHDLDAGVDVVRGEGHVAGHGDVAAGVVDIVGVVSPAGEHLVAALEPAAVLDLCERLIFVAVFVGYRGVGSGVVGQIVDLALKDCLDGGVAVDGAVDVNGGAVLVYPLENGSACLGDLGLGIIEHVYAGDDRADGDLVIGRGIAERGNLHRQRDGLLDPVCKEGEFARRHRLSCEVVGQSGVGYLTDRNLIPALEHCVLAEAGRTSRFAAFVGKRSPELHLFRSFSTVVVFDKIIFVAGVIKENVALYGRVDDNAAVFENLFIGAFGGHAGYFLLSPIAAFRVGILRIFGTLVIVYTVEPLAFVAVCGTCLIEALKHIVEVIKTVCVVVCGSGFPIPAAKISRHGKALGNGEIADAGNVPTIEVASAGEVGSGRP